MQVYPHYSTRADTGNSNTASGSTVQVHPHYPTRVYTEHLHTPSKSEVQVHPHNSTHADTGNSNNTASETKMQVHPHSSSRVDTVMIRQSVYCSRLARNKSSIEDHNDNEVGTHIE